MRDDVKPAILAVDDDPEVLRSVARDLRQKYGGEYRILRAESATVALQTIRTLREREESLALIVSDQRMPGMDGVGLLAECKKIEPGTKRVLLTAYADTEAAIAAINRSQVDYYLLKPWDPPEERLYPVIDDLLDDWRGGFRPGFGGVRVIGHRWSPRSHEIKDYLARNHVPYVFVDVERPGPMADQLALELRGEPIEPSRLPYVVIPGGARLSCPTLRQVAESIGLGSERLQPFYDLVIVGAGPAGLAASVYAASEGLRTALVEQAAPGGQAGTSSRIENYLGFPSGLSGSELARRAAVQARRFGVEMITPAEARSLEIEGPYKKLRLDDGNEVVSHVLMLSMGISWRQLEAPGAAELTGSGVYYGAALSEAASAAGEEVYIVGAGNSAGQAAMFFAEHARKVHVIVRGRGLGERMSQYLVERLESSDKIQIHLRTEVAACRGREHLEEITLRSVDSGAERSATTTMLFIFIGAAPRTEWLGGLVARDERGFVLTGPDLSREHLARWPLSRSPFLLETNVPGIFAAGDVRHESIKRVASAVGEGSISVHFMHRYLASL